MNNVFGKKKIDPVEQTREWTRTLNREMRALERQIKTIDREEQKVVNEIKKLAKEGPKNNNAVKILANQIVLTRQTKARIYEGRAQMHSVQMQLQHNMAIIKVAGCMQKSTEVMAAMGKLIKIPEIQKTMADLAREMERAGLTEEIIGEALDTSEANDEEISAEVEKVIAEITNIRSARANTAPTTPQVVESNVDDLPQINPNREEPSTAVDDEFEEMKARLESL